MNRDMCDLRALDPKTKLFFMYTTGVRKALHNARWALRCCEEDLFDGLDIYVATPINHLSVVPFILVSKDRLGDVRDPHIKEHKWQKITIVELERLHEEMLNICDGVYRP